VSDAVAVAAADTSSELYLATRSGTLFHSADAGESWNAVGAVTAGDVVDLLIRPNGDVLLLTGTGTLFRSMDDGASFEVMGVLTGSNIKSMTADEDDALYALTSTGVVYRSGDEGATWSVIGAVTTSDAVELRAAGPELFVLTSKGDVARSIDLGGTWVFVGTLSQVHVSSLTWDGNILAAATTEGLIATSGDGVTWTWVGSINQVEVVSLGNDTPVGTGVGPDGTPLYRVLEFDRPWPNPWSGGRSAVSFRFRLPHQDVVTLELYDVAGRLITRRAPEKYSNPGEFTIDWKMTNVRSGIFFVRLITSTGLEAHHKLVFVR
jgi:hypothetical protein